ncbi:zinc-dependent alcohol dehydrogenase family protein [Pseudonocardia alaniniphila]|uniref:NAD(P)-dependent alcohol dehydrogenase n=1 Tax=Pseudonocardia alaniniphila TaxID=75291 RepID=A0ABS9TT75_9PSEU|nr:NAD(P)-dependent alcohol dehydrogenase [Pseudonocardia alaniniphila]MCH6171767.1 NAD(P)-dependent alcohol dehydrogenase [Pseudonocardia alaniniphila]
MQSVAYVIDKPGRLSKPITRAAAGRRAGEVLLRIHATSVNYKDYLGVVTGELPDLTWPRVPFADASAEVVEVGDGVANVSIGDRVIPSFFPKWQAGDPTADGLSLIHGDQVDGMLQTHVCVSSACLVPTPAHLSDVEAATLGCAGVTAWRACSKASVKPGHTVVIQGTGGVSLFALGFAKMAGATVVLTSSSDAKLERGRALGADHTINYGRIPEWSTAVSDITDGRGADAIIDVGGGHTLAQSVRSARIGGHIACVGFVSGRESAEFPNVVVMAKNITMVGSTVGSIDDTADMCRAIDVHKFRPSVDRVFPFGEAQEAVDHLLTQGHFGKVSITM